MLPDLFGEFYSGDPAAAWTGPPRKAGLHLLVSSSHADAGEVVAGLNSTRGRIDGLIVMAPDLDASEAIRARAADLPLVLIDPGKGFEGCDTVAIANQAGANAIAAHLAGLGHRRVATITGPARNADARQRLEGYRAALRAAGVEPAPGYEIPGDFTEPSGYAAGSRLWRSIRARPRCSRPTITWRSA